MDFAMSDNIGTIQTEKKQWHALLQKPQVFRCLYQQQQKRFYSLKRTTAPNETARDLIGHSYHVKVYANIPANIR